MAKQYGLHKLGGKVDGQSYYYSKNGGYVSRKVNPGMSERVKTGKEYANTRKNNSEFGMCGDFAGALIRPISQRWRFILDSIATGKMVKEVKNLLTLDAAGTWGQRTITIAAHSFIMSKFNSFSKNALPQYLIDSLVDGIDQNINTNQITFNNFDNSMSDEQMQEFLAQGVNHVSVQYYGIRVLPPVFNADQNAYDEAYSELIPLSNANVNKDIVLGTSIPVASTENVAANKSLIDTEDQFAGVLAICLPGRKIAGEVSVLQELCSAAIFLVNQVNTEP